MVDNSDAQILVPLGLSTEEDAIYRHLLGASGSSANEITASCSVSRDKARAALARLQEQGLITRTGDKERGFVAMPPHLVIENLAARRREEIERARLAAARLTSAITTGGGERGIAEIITVVEGRETMKMHCRQLQAGAKKEMVGFERPPYSSPADQLSGTEPVLARGVSCRFLYEPSVFELPGYLTLLRSQMAAGEQARMVPELPVWMLIVDRETALVPLDVAKQAAGGAVLIHSSWLLDALLTLFEALWNQAVPLPPDLEDLELTEESPGITEQDHKILLMMAAGTKDAVIARQLGIDPSTARRHIARLVKSLGAQSRFQAGIQAARRGWI